MAPKKSKVQNSKSKGKTVSAANTTKVVKKGKKEATKATKVAEEAKEIEEEKEEEEEEKKDEIVQELKVKETVVKKAVEALSKWNIKQNESSSKKDLFETDDQDIPLYLQITSNKYLSNNKIIKPRMLTVPHSIYDLEDAKVCLFIKDDLINEDSLNRIEILKEDKLKNLGQIITVKDLKTKYHSYESKRKLLNEYDIFLTDSSIANMIPKLLGKIFFQSSKFPLTISITDNKRELSIDKLIKNFNKSLNSIGYMLPMGVNMSIKLGMLGQTIENLIENIKTIFKFLEKFSIRSIQIKLKNSPSLPLYISKKIYTDDDIENSNEDGKINENNNNKNNIDDEIPLSIYAEGLKELGLDEEEADKFFSNKRKLENTNTNNNNNSDNLSENKSNEEPKNKKGKK